MLLFDLLDIDNEKIIRKIKIDGKEFSISEFLLANIISGCKVPPEKWIVKKIYLTKDGKGIGLEVE